MVVLRCSRILGLMHRPGDPHAGKSELAQLQVVTHRDELIDRVLPVIQKHVRQPDRATGGSRDSDVDVGQSPGAGLVRVESELGEV